MADTIVVARLVIDETGAVKSVDKLTQSTQTLEKQTGHSGNAITEHFFSMRRAAAAFLGAFTIAGAILMLRNMVTEFLHMDRAWISIKNTARAAFEVMAAGASSTGWIRDLLDSVPDFIASITAMFQTFGQKGMLYELLFGDFDKFTKAMQANIAHIKAVAKEITLRDFLGLPSPTEIRDVTTVAHTALVTIAQDLNNGNIPAIDFIERMDTINKKLLQVGERGEAINNLTAGMLILRTAWERGDVELRDLVATANRWEALARQSGASEAYLKQFRALIPTMARVKDMFRELGDTLTKAKLTYDLITGAANTFAQAVTAAFEEGGGGFRKFMATMLRGIGQMLLAWGALALVTAYFGYGPGAAAGATAIAAGIAALAAARAISPSESGSEVRGSANSGFVGAGALGGVGGNNYNINVSVEGRSSPDATGRAVALAIKRALADGAAGGALV